MRLSPRLLWPLAAVWAILAVLNAIAAVRGPDALFLLELRAKDDTAPSLARCVVEVETIYGSKAALVKTADDSWTLKQTADSGRRAVRAIWVGGASDDINRLCTMPLAVILQAEGEQIELSLRGTAENQMAVFRPLKEMSRYTLLGRFRECFTYRGDLSILIHSAASAAITTTNIAAVLLLVTFAWHFAKSLG